MPQLAPQASLGRRLLIPIVLTLAAVPAIANASPAGSATPTVACSPVTTRPHYTGSVPSPTDVLGYPFGSRPATDTEIGTYLHAADQASDRVVTGTYATSWQHRPLRYALVGNPYTLAHLRQIRADLMKIRDPDTSASEAAQLERTTPTILWITANVHGNEPSGGDAVLKLLYELADRDDCVSRAILQNALVGLIPTQNPDGRANDLRTNAYAFDMNRDWFARTQPETAGKLDLLWKYPPQLYVDEHEMSGRDYFFPPDSDPIYHETPNPAYTEISHLYGNANAAAFQQKGWSYETYQSGYDLFYQGYGDTVPTTEFGAAGMTYEQGDASPYPARTAHQFLSALVTLYTGATNREHVLANWRKIFVTAQAEGQQCTLERNATFNPGDQVLRQVPDRKVCGYFLRGGSAETQLVIRRLQLAHVEVDQLIAPVVVPDYRAYGRAPTRTTLPAGTYYVSMAQPQKHWIQAMLNEDTYVPFPYFYDVSGWSNPLLAGIAGGSTGLHLDMSLVPLRLFPAPNPPKLPKNPPRVGIIDQRPEPDYMYQTTGWLRWRLAQDWHVPYTALSPKQVTAAALSKLDVLLVPNVDAGPTYNQMGPSGRRALKAWIRAGGRFVGWQEATTLAVRLGISSVQLSNPKASSPGALMRIDGPHPNEYALWDEYYSPVIDPNGAGVVAQFPAHMFVSGYAEQADTLAGTPVETVEQLGSGSTTLFTVEPNFRGYSDSTARLLFDAMLSTPTPLHSSVVPDVSTPGSTTVTLPTTAQHVAYDRGGKS